LLVIRSNLDAVIETSLVCNSELLEATQSYCLGVFFGCCVILIHICFTECVIH